MDNTEAVIALCRQAHADTGARVFTFGIGNDVSQALVRGAAAAGTYACRADGRSAIDVCG